MLRKFLDKIHPPKNSKWYPFYEAVDTLLYLPGTKTKGLTHLRDGVNFKRIMITVVMLAFPTLIFGSYIIGFNAISALENGSLSTNTWHVFLIDLLLGKSYSSTSIIDCLVYGLIYTIPIYLVSFTVGSGIELIISTIRGHEISEGVFVTTILFALILPTTIPLWQVALGIAFGIIIGKEVFGGTGKNIFNPALVARAFLYFSYPGSISGNNIWVAVDSFSSATPLSLVNESGLKALYSKYSITDVFLGNIAGSIGETSTLLLIICGVILCLTRIASYRIILGGVIGVILASILFNLLSPNQDSYYNLPFYWHLSLGGFAFGIFFMATDPVSATITNLGRWFYGGLIGFVTILIRVYNPAYPEGVMLAILLANAIGPTLDYYIIKSHNVRRQKRIQKINLTT